MFFVKLDMLHTKHFAVTIVPAVLIAYKFSILEGVFFFAGGTLIDIDHFFDYLFLNHGDLNYKKLVRLCEEYKLKKILLLLHSWEIVIPGLLLSIGKPSLFIFIGAIYHLIFDQFTNRSKILTYFLSYRLINKLDLHKIINLRN